MTVSFSAVELLNPRDIKVPGRDAKGIYFAVDFLTAGNQKVFWIPDLMTKIPYELAKGKNVLVIGGGDTGNDCVGTSIRLGCEICDTAGDDAEASGSKSCIIIHGRSGRKS